MGEAQCSRSSISYDERGFRRISTTPRPSKYTPDEWRKMSPTVRKGIAKAEEKKIEAEKEKKKSDAKIKESEERAKRKEEKKKEKEAKKAKSSKKDDKDDHVSGVAMSQDYVRRGKVFQYGKGSVSPVGRGSLPLLHVIQTYQTLMYLMMMTF